jgi:hypothetical protein
MISQFKKTKKCNFATLGSSINDVTASGVVGDKDSVTAALTKALVIKSLTMGERGC